MFTGYKEKLQTTLIDYICILHNANLAEKKKKNQIYLHSCVGCNAVWGWGIVMFFLKPAIQGEFSSSGCCITGRNWQVPSNAAVRLPKHA